MDTRISIAIAAGAALALGLQGYLLWRLTRALGGLQRLDEKLGHFGDALSLLTETTETGFRAVAAEIDRVQPSADGTPRKALPRASNARINAAARRGRTVAEIAAAEELSEGEVRLKLHLAKQAAHAAHAKTPRARHAATRETRVPASIDNGSRTKARHGSHSGHGNTAAQEQQHGTVRA